MAYAEHDRKPRRRNGPLIGDGVLVFSKSNSAWTPGTVIGILGTLVRIMYCTDGNVFTKVSVADSPELQFDKVDQDTGDDEKLDGQESEQSGHVGTCDIASRRETIDEPIDQEWRKRLSVGSNVQVYSATAKAYVEAIVTAISLVDVKCLYWMKGSCLIKTMPLDSLDLRQGHQESDQELLAEASSDSAKKTSLVQEAQALISDAHGGSPLHVQIPSKFASHNADPFELEYILHDELAECLHQPHIQVIDVRDLDFCIGHITGARNVPHQVFHRFLRKLAAEFVTSGKTLVFHCMNSAHRSPACAQLFMQYLSVFYIDVTCHVCVLKGGFTNWNRCYAHLNNSMYISSGLSDLALLGAASTSSLPPVSVLSEPCTLESRCMSNLSDRGLPDQAVRTQDMLSDYHPTLTALPEYDAKLESDSD
eukprot:gnl/TRDRNA2_/TRDRNA2_30330_c0_seq1.p1 gnl/TRDRNA2_/TRDRNA2_30330_c0~~gnl/TRDRNA2_/TRDRNA2_30330_c0_seq1.p1  ORF type:complete len:422 (-),score=58.96 gnl/TRDRNA2_/TRDRNA2_30330_c0_seq1:72-1337(-)